MVSNGVLIAAIIVSLFLGGSIGLFVAAFMNVSKNDIRLEKRGKWIYNPCADWLPGTDAPLNYHCSLCKYDVVQEENYCPNCGVKMEREVDDK